MKYKAPVGQLDPEATYIDKDPALGVKGSPVPAYFVNATMNEIVNAIIMLGGSPKEIDFEQLGKQIKDYIEQQFAIKQATNSEISNKYNIQKYINPSQASRYLGFYDENRSYDINEVVVLNGMIYYSLVDDNIDNNPTTSTNNWANYADFIASNYTKVDGSNAIFNSLTDTAKSNILSFAMPILKTAEGIGQVIQIRLKGGPLVAPVGGTWFYFYATYNRDHTLYFDENNINNNNDPSAGICAGGTILTSDLPAAVLAAGYFIRIA